MDGETKKVTLPRATYIDGNRGYVAYRRGFPSRQKEIVVYRVDEASTWARVRRVKVPDISYAQLVISDGTVFLQEPDAERPGRGTLRIVAYLPDGSSQVLWRDEEESSIRLEILGPLLVGPP